MTNCILAEEARKISSGNKTPIKKKLLSDFDKQTSKGRDDGNIMLESIYDKIIDTAAKFKYNLDYNIFSRISSAALLANTHYYRSLVNTIADGLQHSGYRVTQHPRKSDDDGTDALYFYETNCLDINVCWK